MSINRVRRLFQICQQHAASAESIAALSNANNTQNFEHFQPLLTALGEITLDDIGASNPAKLFRPGVISLLNIHNSDALWLGLFCLSKGVGFPIHDHPEMNGFVKLVHGQLKLRSLHEVAREPNTISVKVVAEAEASSPAVLAVGPERNNFHEIWAMQPSIIFQVFIPNYSQKRLCTFYRVADEKAGICKLHSAPTELASVELPYQGLRPE